MWPITHEACPGNNTKNAQKFIKKTDYTFESGATMTLQAIKIPIHVFKLFLWIKTKPNVLTLTSTSIFFSIQVTSNIYRHTALFLLSFDWSVGLKEPPHCQFKKDHNVSCCQRLPPSVSRDKTLLPHWPHWFLMEAIAAACEISKASCWDVSLPY